MGAVQELQLHITGTAASHNRLIRLPPCLPLILLVLAMGAVQELQLHITGERDEPCSQEDAASTNEPKFPPSSDMKHWRWWLLVALNIIFILVGQTAGNLLGRFYFDKGGNSKWLATLVQSVGFPVIIPILFISSNLGTRTPIIAATSPSRLKIASIYTAFGFMGAGNNLMYTYGLMFLPVSTYSLLCSTQLAFNAVFSYFINSQKFTHLILNSVVLLTFSAVLLGIRSDSTIVVHENYPLGFILTVCASATFSLFLSLTQLTFEKIVKKETFSVVLEMQICISLVSSSVIVAGLFASGEWRKLQGEMEGFETGRVSYLMTVIWTAVSWQMCSVGFIGSVLIVSSLFSNVMSTVALPITPILAVVFFHDKMDGVKVMSMLIAVWGFLSYIYQHYLDDLGEKESKRNEAKDTSGTS